MNVRRISTLALAIAVLLAAVFGSFASQGATPAFAKAPTCKTSKQKKTSKCKKAAYVKKCNTSSKRKTVACSKTYLALYCKTAKAKKTYKCVQAKKNANKKQSGSDDNSDNSESTDDSPDNDPATDDDEPVVVPTPATPIVTPDDNPSDDDTPSDDTPSDNPAEPVVHLDQDPECGDGSEALVDSKGVIECRDGSTPECNSGYTLGVDASGGPACRWTGEAADGGTPNESDDTPAGYCLDGSTPYYAYDEFPTCDNGAAPIAN